MNTLRIDLVCILCSLLLAGCTAKLEIYKDEREVKGVPFRTPVGYVVKGFLTQHSEGKPCNKQTRFTKLIYLPVGDLYYAKVKTGWLAGSDFSISFHEGGVLQQITLNSKASLAETLEGAASLVGQVAPVPAAPTDDKTISCDTGELIDTVELLSDWLEKHLPKNVPSGDEQNKKQKRKP